MARVSKIVVLISNRTEGNLPILPYLEFPLSSQVLLPSQIALIFLPLVLHKA